MKQYALKLYDYHVWANKRLFERVKELPEDVYDQEIQSVFPSIAETFAHLYIVDTVWLGVMRDDGFEDIQAASRQAAEAANEKSIEEMETLFTELTGRYREFLDSQEDLEKPMAPEHPAFGRLETHLSELIQHVVNHGTYHRGNITAMIRQQGHESVMTDYIMYLYEADTEKS
ncbi:MAG TPA: DinB family protein [Bacillales bacterium]|nr:DinB family protein [Bacillales bacterium]